MAYKPFNWLRAAIYFRVYNKDVYRMQVLFSRLLFLVAGYGRDHKSLHSAGLWVIRCALLLFSSKLHWICNI